jgi:DNA-binding transcriptional ArsR family regulator
MPPDVFTAIADPTRREILRLLADEKIPVQILVRRFKVSRPAISRHLRVLRQAGLVTEQKEGRQRFYRLEADRLEEVRRWVTYFDRFWLESLNVLKTLAEEQDDGADTTQHPD